MDNTAMVLLNYPVSVGVAIPPTFFKHQTDKTFTPGAGASEKH
jgi:hypothetical protein